MHFSGSEHYQSRPLLPCRRPFSARSIPGGMLMLFCSSVLLKNPDTVSLDEVIFYVFATVGVRDSGILREVNVMPHD